MDNFKAVYKILSALEASMDYEEFDAEQISPQALGVSQPRWNRYIEMMSDAGYIKDVEIKTYVSGAVLIDISDIQITLKGLEYLQENNLMRKAYRTLKGIKDVTPMV